MNFPPHGYGIPLVDFAFFVIFAMLADRVTPPAPAYRWLWFLLCLILAILFFLAWLVDLGANI